MDIPSQQVFEVLSAKGVTELHHVNSVATACQFIRSRSLMSRGTVERMGVAQTAQSSDKTDRIYGIWFDVFLDSVDIHERARRANVYGPVLFVFDIGLIHKNGTGRIWVTKENPTKWADKAKDERWFQGKTELAEIFTKGTFDQMLVLRHCGGEFPFGKHLVKIILDDPSHQTQEDVDCFSMAVGALRLAMQDAGLNVPIERRTCRPRCTCKAEWQRDSKRLLEMFDPKIT